MRVWVRRGLIWPVAVAIVITLGALLAIHTPWARGRALAWAGDFVTRYDLTLRADDLGFNAVTRRITLTGVRLAAKGHDDRPFLVAKRIQVKLPWIVFRGRFAIDHLEIDNGVVDIYRDANNVTNLPPSSGGPTPVEARRLDIRGLTLRGLDVQYTDMVRDFGVTVPRIEATLVDAVLGAEGAFAVRGPLAVRLRQRTLTIAPFETVMTFDGSNVALKDARLVSSELNAFLSGQIYRVLDSTTLDLTLKGTIDLANAMRWIPPPPVPVAGTVTVDGTIKGPTSEVVTTLQVTSNTLAVGRERDLALNGPVLVTFESFSGTQLAINPKSGGEIRADFNVPWGSASVSKANASWQGLDAQAALDMGNVSQQPIGAALEGSGEFEFGEPRRFVIRNRSTGRNKARHVPMTGTLQATIVGDDYKLDHDHKFPGFTFAGRMAGRINRETALLSTMTGPGLARMSDVATASASLATLGFPVPEIAAEIHGSVDLPMTLGGSYRFFEVDTQVTSDAVDLPLIGRVRASAHVVADTRRADITEVEIHRGTASITGGAVANITASTWTGNFNVDAPHAEELQSDVPEAWRVTGPVQVAATLGGTFDVYTLDTTITGESLTWAGQVIDRATAKALVTSEAIDVTSLELRQGPGFLDGRVRYAWETGAYTASLKGDRLSWQGTVLAPNDTQALFSMQFDGTGTTAQPRGQARVDFALSGGKAGTLIGGGELTADLMGDTARVVARLPSIGALLNADIATSSPYDYQATAVLDRLELARLSPFLDAVPAEILGFASGNVTASGRLADALNRVAVVNLTELDAGIGGVPVSLNAPMDVSLRGDDVTVKNLDVRMGSGRLTASGEFNTKLNGVFQGQFSGDFQDAIRMGRAFGVPVTFDGSGAMTADLRSNGSRAGTTATLSLKGGTFNWGGGPHAVTNLTVAAALQGESLTVSRISGDVASGGVVGSFSASARADMPVLELSAIAGELTVDTARFTFSGIPVEQQRPSRIEFARGSLAVADVSWSVANNPIVFGGSVGFAAEDPPLNLSVQGLVDLRVLSAFVSTLAFDGNADVNTRIEGTVSKPLLDGRITLVDAEVAVSSPRLVLTEMAGLILLDGEQVILQDVRGLANGGAVAFDGALEVVGFALSGGSVSIQAQGVAVELIEGLRSEIDALVTYRPDPRSPSLAGDIRIAQSSYTETITIAALARRATLPVSPTVQQPYLDRIRLNLSVTTTDDIFVDNNYGRLEASANLRVVGTAAAPGVDGRITLREGGEIFLAGRTFRITRGDISFIDLRRIHPEFNITAEAALGAGDTVTMTLTGTLERPSIDLTSQDGSRTPGELASDLVGNSNSEAALTLLSADLLGVTGRAIGLDAFRVERGDFQDQDFRDDPAALGANNIDLTTRLTISKRISSQVEFTVSQNLRESGKTTVIVSYFPTRTVEVRALSRDNASVSLGVRHQLTFGRGESRPPTERRVRPIVSEINFDGVEPAIEQEVRNQISLDPGERFDFLVLQRDIDRLRARFFEQGFLEARVRTRRVADEENNTVALEYRVNRGPRTELQIVGAVLPSNVMRELEQAWGRNAFDQFLVEDLTKRVRRHLVTTNELNSVVVGTVDRPSPDVKRLRIEVTPGFSVTGREIRFTGNKALDGAALGREITASGLVDEAWLDRTLVERALVTAYHEAGYLKATVVGQPLSVDGEIGVLSFVIVEGAQAQITDLRWAGVPDSRLPDMQKAADIVTPAPYVATDVTAALRRVEDEYRKRGYNNADIELVPSVDDSAVTLTMNVIEGPQQVLQEVVTAGNEITNDRVVTQALRFKLGEPVDLDDWAQARKRLYDTNVFRLVDIQPVPVGEVVDGVQPVKAQITVEEFPEWQFRYGLQLEGERNPSIDEFASSRAAGAVAEIKNPNLFGRALTGGAFGMYQYDRRDATVFLSTSRLFGWRARSNLYGFYSRDRIRDDAGEEILAITDIQGISADQRWRRRGIQLVYGYRFERGRTFDPEPGNDPSPLDFVSNVASVTGAVLFDRRDDPLASRKGTFSSISYDHSALWLGSDIRNRKLLAQQYVFVPLGKVVLASRVQLGKKFGVDDLFSEDRFRAGGATTVRGYREDGLGEVDFEGVPTGGDGLIVLNQEVRFPLFKWVNGVGFVDAGNVLAKGEKLGFGGIKVGYGFGLRINTPVGLLRADMGIPQSTVTTTSGTTPKKYRFYFGIGHIF